MAAQLALAQPQSAGQLAQPQDTGKEEVVEIWRTHGPHKPIFLEPDPDLGKDSSGSGENSGEHSRSSRYSKFPFQ